MRKLIILIGVFTLVGCAMASGSVRENAKEELKSIKSIKIGYFQCADEALAQIIKDGIIAELLKTDILIENQGQVGAEIVGAVALRAFASGGFFGNVGVAGSSNKSISSISAKILVNGRIKAVASVQPASANDPPQYLGRVLGQKIVKMLR